MFCCCLGTINGYCCFEKKFMNLPTVLLIKQFMWHGFYMPLFSLRSNRMHGFTLSHWLQIGENNEECQLTNCMHMVHPTNQSDGLWFPEQAVAESVQKALLCLIRQMLYHNRCKLSWMLPPHLIEKDVCTWLQLCKPWSFGWRRCGPLMCICCKCFGLKQSNAPYHAAMWSEWPEACFMLTWSLTTGTMGRSCKFGWVVMKWTLTG